MGSDGLFDNLFDEQIKSCVKAYHSKDSTDFDPQTSAVCIATYAEFVSYDEKNKGPFYKSAVEFKGEDKAKKYIGGKEDDITVVVAQVKFSDQL